MPSRFQNPAVVYRSARQRACDERAFVLTAVGIDSEIELDGDAYAVRVDATVQAHALHHLWQYEQERQVVRPPEPLPEFQPYAWLGAVLFAMLLLLVPLTVGQGWSQADLYAIGVMDPPRIRAGEWWRAWTALTLHWDAAHLVGNLGAGVLLGYSAAQIWGNARAWALIITAAAVANLLEAAVAGSSRYVSAGASTVVFAALGLIAAWSWRTRRQFAHNSMRRWVPLVAGIAVLALFGAGDAQMGGVAAPAEGADHTNVLSHALGFITGALAGVAVATARGSRLMRGIPTWLAAVIAAGPLVAGWAIALLAPLQFQ
ncbi:MAG: rhomboid family intramembrane serine protease [Steroidobacteraceae bacterium]